MSTALTGSEPTGQPAPDQSSGNPATTSWHETLPEDLKSNGSLKQFKDVASLAKSYVHAQSMIGKKGVVVPGEKASDEEWGAFYKGIGVPDLDKYEIALQENEGVAPESLAKFKELAHKNGLLPKQAQALFGSIVEQEKQSRAAKMEEQTRTLNEQIGGLKKEWGEGYEKQVAFARVAVKELGGEEFSKYLDESGMGNDVNLIKVMAKVGAMLGEDKIRGEGGGKFGMTPAEINSEIMNVMGNEKHPYHDSTHPGHKAAVAQMADYFKKLGR